MAAEDDDERELAGPPPDPSTRAWRHPSEVAAANVAAAQGPTPPRGRRRWSPLSFGMGGLFGAVLAVAAVGATTTAFESQPSGRIEFRHNPTSLTLDGLLDDEAADAADTVVRESGITTTLGAGGTTLAGAQLGRPTDVAGTDLPGILTLFHLDGTTPVASAMVIDGLIFTSASALEGAERVVFVLDGTHHEAMLRGSDPFSDVAVLTANETLALPAITPAPHHGIAGDPIRLVATDGQPRQIVVEGEILSTDELSATRDGHPVLDALFTSARVPEGGGGAALVNKDNEVIALVIDSDDYLAVAVSLDTARAVGESIAETGWPQRSWLGIEGQSDDEGVVLTNVENGSPAALAGLAVGDRLISVNDQQLDRMVDIIGWMRTVGSGGELRFEVITGDSQWTTRVTVGERQIRQTGG